MTPKFFTRANVSAAIIGLSLLIMVLITAGCTSYVRRGETPDTSWAQYSEGLKHELGKGRNADVSPTLRD